jgi:hypothetical protein
MTKSIITNSRDLLNAIAKMEREMNGISDDIRNLKSAKATINQPTNNQLLTWDSEISMVEDSLWQLPAADGAANEIMYTDGAGNLAWIAPGAAAVAGADTQVQYNAGGVMAAEAAFTYNYGTNTLTTDHIQATIDFAPSAADGASLGTAALEFSDLYLADGGIIYLGDDQDVTLTHIADTGIRINSTMQLQFRDAAIYIASLDDGHLDLKADTQIDLNSAVYLNVCADAGADVNAFLVRDAGGFIDYRTGTELLADLSGDAGAAFSFNSQDVTNVATLYGAYVDLTNCIDLVNTISAITGVVRKNGDRFIHDFKHPTGGGAIPVGHNLFIGEDAGNFTMGAAATNISEASYNLGIGWKSLLSVALGYNNIAIGPQALTSLTDAPYCIAIGRDALALCTTGGSNLGIGYSALYKNTTGRYNTAIGRQALYNCDGGEYNCGISTQALNALAGGDSNCGIGYRALFNIVDPDYNVGIGHYAGAYIVGGGNNTAGSNSIFIGVDTRPAANGETNEIVIGYQGNGIGSNTTVIGNASTVTARIYGDIQIDSDTDMIIFGDGQDAGIYYNGSNLVYNSTLVGAGAHAFTGTVRLNTCADAGTDTDKFLVRDAANNIDYRTGAELLADLSGDAAASFDWNSQELDNVGWLGINTAADSNRYINIDDAALSFTSTFYGIYQSLTKTAGASDAGDYYYGIYNVTELNQAGGKIGYARGIQNEFQLTDGDIGDASNSRNLMSIYSFLDLNGGKIYGDVRAGYFSIDQEAGNEITTDAVGVRIYADLDGTVGGISYMLHLIEGNGIDYGIYQEGVAQNRLGGILDIWSSAKTIFLGADEGLNTRTDNTNKRCHIQCTQYDTDADGMAILATLCNVGQNLLLIGGRGSMTGNAPTAIYFTTSANTTAGAGASALGIESDGGVYLYIVKSGATQAAAGASAGEIWETSGHASLPDHVLMLGA